MAALRAAKKCRQKSLLEATITGILRTIRESQSPLIP